MCFSRTIRKLLDFERKQTSQNNTTRVEFNLGALKQQSYIKSGNVLCLGTLYIYGVNKTSQLPINLKRGDNSIIVMHHLRAMR